MATGGGSNGGDARSNPCCVLRVEAICVSACSLVCVLAIAWSADANALTHRQQNERQQALKLLREIELIVAEVSVRLVHLENQAEDAIANEGREDSESPEEQEINSTLNSCTLSSACSMRIRKRIDL